MGNQKDMLKYTKFKIRSIEAYEVHGGDGQPYLDFDAWVPSEETFCSIGNWDGMWTQGQPCPEPNLSYEMEPYFTEPGTGRRFALNSGEYLLSTVRVTWTEYDGYDYQTYTYTKSKTVNKQLVITTQGDDHDVFVAVVREQGTYGWNPRDEMIDASNRFESQFNTKLHFAMDMWGTFESGDLPEYEEGTNTEWYTDESFGIGGQAAKAALGLSTEAWEHWDDGGNDVAGYTRDWTITYPKSAKNHGFDVLITIYDIIGPANGLTRYCSNDIVIFDTCYVSGNVLDIWDAGRLIQHEMSHVYLAKDLFKNTEHSQGSPWVDASYANCVMLEGIRNDDWSDQGPNNIAIIDKNTDLFD